MSLVANTVDLEAVGLDELNDSRRACSFIAIVFKVVVVILCDVSGDRVG